MFLNNLEEKILSGEWGQGYQYAMELLVTIGETFDADRLIDITKAHWALSGQEGDLYFAKKLADGGAQTKVPVTTNPDWDPQLKTQFKVNLTDNELALLRDTLETCDRLNVIKSFSCTPYLEINHPEYGEHVSFSESSASPFINSVYGALTNRESSVSALAAGVIGKTPNYGLHLKENRSPTVVVNVDATVNGDFDFGILGWHLGKMIEPNSVPFLRNIRSTPSAEGLRDFGALLNTTNAVAMYHISGITPEAKEFEKVTQNGIEKIEIKERDLSETKRELSNYHGEINSVFLGCPHSTINEINLVYKLLDGRKVKDDVKFLVFTSNTNFKILQANGMITKLNSLGVSVLKDSCVDEPVFKFAEGKMGATNSAKAAYYRARRNQKFTILDIPKLVEAGVRGYV
ncbi:MAG: aconitase X catalytic domain-containing protein [Thermoplasmatales archaeon]